MLFCLSFLSRKLIISTLYIGLCSLGEHKRSSEMNSVFCYVPENQHFSLKTAQRKIGSTKNPGCFGFSSSPAQSMRSEPFGVARAACFEQLAGVFASCGALHYAKILASLKMKNGISLTPLNCALKAFTFALNDSADAFVERLSK